MALVGPTAVGKTALALHLAEALEGEVVSADSRQVYQRMDIGTAKATPDERARVPHHLLDVVEPDDVLTLAQFQRLAYGAIDDILARGRLPLLAGGSGQYVRAVLEGWGIPEVAPQARLRAELERLSSDELARWLEVLDPTAAGRIDRRNRRRVIRALEVTLVTGQPISQQQKKSPPPYQILQVGLELERSLLHQRVDARVDWMMQAGLLEETRRLAQRYAWNVPAMSGLGYAQLGAYLRGEVSLDQAVIDIKHETHRFVRQQANWFKPNAPNIHWFKAAEPELAAQKVERFVREWLAT